jgi:hypothetical protein
MEEYTEIYEKLTKNPRKVSAKSRGNVLPGENPLNCHAHFPQDL